MIAPCEIDSVSADTIPSPERGSRYAATRVHVWRLLGRLWDGRSRHQCRWLASSPFHHANLVNRSSRLHCGNACFAKYEEVTYGVGAFVQASQSWQARHAATAVSEFSTSTVGSLQRSLLFSLKSHCRTNFLLSCRAGTTCRGAA